MSVQLFWDEQSVWSQATFGPDSERGPVGPLKHLEKEAKEAYTEEDNERLKEEIADCLFLTFDAARRAGMTLHQLVDYAFRKLEKNKKRKWSKPVEGQPCEHIRGEHD